MKHAIAKKKKTFKTLDKQEARRQLDALIETAKNNRGPNHCLGAPATALLPPGTSYGIFNTQVGKYYIRFEDESLITALSNFGAGFDSVQDASKEAESLEGGQGLLYWIFDYRLTVIETGRTSQGRIVYKNTV